MERIVAVAAGLISLLTLAWASGAPLALGLRIWTEQLLIAVLALAMAVCFVTRSFRRRPRPPAEAPLGDRALALIALAYGVFLVLRFPYLSENLFYARDEALVVACIGLALLVETVRRAIGWPLIAILGAVGLYALFSDQLSGPLQSRAIPLDRLITFAILDSASMVGAALTIAVVVVVPYIILARLLMASGGAAFFSDLSVALLGGARGGAGKIAVMSSAFFGSISGSAVSNVASTGAITIPLMTRAGYSPKTAGAIEAAASTGGQLVPPIMGASAFLLAENLQVAYSEVVIAALVPSLLYYAALLIFADLEAARRGLAAIDGPRDAPLAVLRRGWFILTPFAALIIGLFSFNLRPETAALTALGVLFAIALVTTYGGGRLRARALVTSLVEAGRIGVEIVLICAVASIVIGLFNLSGLSFGLTFFLVEIGKGSLFLLLLLTAVLCILLGMGLPTVGVYLLLAALATPPLIEFGLEPMAAHLFVLYFGMMSMISPPVAIAAFVAANMAHAPPMATAFEAVRVGWPAFVAPFLFVASPALLLAGPSGLETALAIIAATAGIYVATSGFVGWIRGPAPPATRLAAAAAGLALLTPHALFDAAALVSLAGAVAAAALWSVDRRPASEARSAPG